MQPGNVIVFFAKEEVVGKLEPLLPVGLEPEGRSGSAASFIFTVCAALEGALRKCMTLRGRFGYFV